MSALSSFINHVVANYYIKDPNIKNVLDIQLPDVLTQWDMARNEICYLLKTKRINNLNTVDFELTTRCNLKCKVCPVNTGLMNPERRQGTMDFELFKAIIDRNPYLRRIRFTLWGEPLLHKDVFKFIAYARQHTKAYLLLYTNGTLLTPEIAQKLVASELNMVVFFIDGAGETYRQNRGFDYAELKSRIQLFMDEKQKQQSDIVTHELAVGTPEVEAQMDAFMQEWEAIGMDSVSVVSYSPFKEKRETNLKRPCRFFWRGYLAVNWEWGCVSLLHGLNGAQARQRQGLRLRLTSFYKPTTRCSNYAQSTFRHIIARHATPAMNTIPNASRAVLPCSHTSTRFPSMKR